MKITKKTYFIICTLFLLGFLFFALFGVGFAKSLAVEETVNKGQIYSFATVEDSQKEYMDYKDLIDQEKSEREQILQILVTPSEAPDKTETEAVKNENKEEISVVFFGDSMTETLSDEKTMAEKLSGAFGGRKVAVDIVAASARSIADQIDEIQGYSKKADLAVIESFAYNPLAGPSEESRDLYKKYLRQALESWKNRNGRVYLLLTIAPNQEIFGQGQNGVNWDLDRRREHSQTIMSYFASAKEIAGDLGVELINCFDSSLLDGAGNEEYIDKLDGIHPSAKGREFIIAAIKEKLKEDIILITN